MIPANEIAESLGDKRLTNMVMMGAMLELLPVAEHRSDRKNAGTHCRSVTVACCRSIRRHYKKELPLLRV